MEPGSTAPVPRVLRSLGWLAAAAAAFALGAQWAAREPTGSSGARVRAALANPDPIARAAALAPVLRDLEEPQLDEVAEAYEATFVVGGPSDTAIAPLCEAWAALDPVSALDRTSTWPDGPRSAARKALLRAWARRNPTAALDWIAGLRDDGTAFEAVVAGWAESGDAEMWNYVAKMEPSMQRETASIAMMQQVVARAGFDGLFARVDAVPGDAPNEFKFAAIGTAVALVADHDPARALAFADRHAGSGYERGLLRRIAIRWVVLDGPAAMGNLLDRPASPERDFALRVAYQTWLRRNRAAALAWMPESAVRDVRFAPLVDVYAVAVANDDPTHRGEAIHRAIEWAERTQDPAKRRETLVLLGVIWLYYEPEAAGPWLAQNGLEAEVRKEAARRNRIQRAAQGSAAADPVQAD